MGKALQTKVDRMVTYLFEDKKKSGFVGLGV